MRKFKMPTAFTVLFAIILVMTVLTWVIPAGQYDYQEDGEPIAGTYHEVESQSQPLSAVLMAPLEGLYEAIDIAAFILMVGGFLGVMAKTGALDAGIANIIRLLKGKEKLLIPILMCAFALGALPSVWRRRPLPSIHWCCPLWWRRGTTPSLESPLFCWAPE